MYTLGRRGIMGVPPYLYKHNICRGVSRPGFRDRDPGIPGRDSLPFPSLLLPGIPGRNEVLINGTKMIRTLVVPVTSDIFSSNYVVFSTVPPGFVSRSRSSLNFPVSRDFPGSLPSHLRDIPNPENLSGAGRDTPLILSLLLRSQFVIVTQIRA